MSTLPAVVTINDLALATTLSSAALFEAMQTTSGSQPESVKANLPQMLGQMNIAGSLVASTGISIEGSTTATIALATTTPLSVLGVAGAATSNPLPIAGTGAQVLRLNDAGAVLGFGAVNLGSSAAVSGVLTVPFGGIGISALATGDLLYASDTTTLARRAISTATQVLQVMAGATTVNFGAVNLTTAVTGTLTVAFGGIGIATLATGDLLYASTATTLARLASVTTGFLLAATGTVTAPAWTTVIGDNVTWRISTTKAQFALATAIPAGGSTTIGVTLSSVANFGIFIGTGVPSLSAGTGSIYLRSDATTAAQRLYVNINGTGAWTNFTTAA